MHESIRIKFRKYFLLSIKYDKYVTQIRHH